MSSNADLMLRLHSPTERLGRDGRVVLYIRTTMPQESPPHATLYASRIVLPVHSTVEDQGGVCSKLTPRGTTVYVMYTAREVCRVMLIVRRAVVCGVCAYRCVCVSFVSRPRLIVQT